MAGVDASSTISESDGMADQQDLAALAKLKNFALKRGYDLDGDLLERINKILRGAKPRPLNDTDRAELDKLIIDLSKTTYPVNINNVANADGQDAELCFVYGIMAIGIAAAICAGLIIWYFQTYPSPAFGAGLSLTLGVVGAVVYVMLPNGKLNMFVGLDASNKANALVRISMGALLGFVLSLIVAPIKNLENPKELLLPLLGGYSITLVVGILAKAIAAIELTFNIDAKSIRSSLRK